MPIAIKRKYDKTKTALFNNTPDTMNQSFFDAIAKIMPSTDRTVNTQTPKVKFAFGPLILKKKIIFNITVNIDKTPKIAFLYKIALPLLKVFFKDGDYYINFLFYSFLI